MVNVQAETDADRIAKELAERAASFIDSEVSIMLIPDHDRKVGLLHAHYWANEVFKRKGF